MATSSFDEILVIENEEEAAKMLEAFEIAEKSEQPTITISESPDIKKIKEIYRH